MRCPHNVIARHVPETSMMEAGLRPPNTGEPICPQCGSIPAFPAAKIPCGNRLLTMISVWLGAERRVDSPRFDMLAGDAGSGFGRATHAAKNRAFAQAYRRG